MILNFKFKLFTDYPQTCDEYFKDFPQKTEGKIFVNGVTTSCSKDKVER